MPNSTIDYYTVEVWDNQIGAWIENNEYGDPEAAYNGADHLYNNCNNASFSSYGEKPRVRIYHHRITPFTPKGQ